MSHVQRAAEEENREDKLRLSSFMSSVILMRISKDILQKKRGKFYGMADWGKTPGAKRDLGRVMGYRSGDWLLYINETGF